MIPNVDQLISDFVSVAVLSGFKTVASDIQHELWKAPHKPKQLPDHFQAVYVFRCLRLITKY